MTGDEQSDKLNAVIEAHERHEKAAEDLCRLTAEAFPVGTMLTVQLGRAVVRGRVTGVNEHWWASPGEVYIENVYTGKHRRFCPYHHRHTLMVESPGTVDAVARAGNDDSQADHAR